MKTRYLILFLLFSFNSSFSQDIIRVGVDYKIPIFQSNVIKVGNKVLTPDYKIRSQSFSSNMSFLFLKRSKFSLWGGVTYQYIHQVIDDYLDSVANYYEYNISGPLVFSDPLDAHFDSHSLGVKFLGDFKLVAGDKFSYNLCLSTEIYIWELFRFRGFKPESDLLTDPADDIKSKVYGVNHFRTVGKYHTFLPFVNLSLENRFSFNLKDKMTLTAKISLGTNVHAEWVQFKRYVWLGTGLELGFWRKKKE